MAIKCTARSALAVLLPFSLFSSTSFAQGGTQQFLEDQPVRDGIAFETIQLNQALPVCQQAHANPRARAISPSLRTIPTT
jgi:hypothetical protein